MSSESEMDHIDDKRIQLEDDHEKISSFDITCSSSVVCCFKNKCMEFFTKQLDDKSVQTYNALNNTGKIVHIVFIKILFSFIIL